MNDFDELCKDFEQLDAASFDLLIAQKSLAILPALHTASEIFGTGDAVSLYATFILAAIAADGKVTEEEFAGMYPLFELFFGENVDYADVRAAARTLKPASKELKTAVSRLVQIMGRLSPELQYDMVIVAMMICAVDGKVSFAEKRWIRQLM